jgi:type I restriction enzyme, S subunit
MRYRAYGTYKDSGVEWLQLIPSNWQLIKMRYVCNINTGSKDTQDNVEDGIYPFFVRSDNVERMNEYTHNEEAVMTAGDGVGVGRVFHYYNGKFAAHQRVYIFSEFKNITGKFLYYYLKSNLKFDVLSSNAKSTVDSLRRPMLSNFIISLPSLNEQNKIVEFLDNKIYEIENIINKKHLQIQTLKKYRQSIITETVTRGLNHYTKMKDSGVEWIGEIPQHWKVCKVGNAFEITLGKMVQPNAKNSKDFEIPYFKAMNVQDGYLYEDKIETMYATQNELKQLSVLKSDVLVCEGGEVARSSVVNKNYDGYIFQNSLHRVRGTKIGYPVYLHYLLNVVRSSGFIDILVNRATIAHFTKDKFSSLKICLPPLEEQIHISQDLERKINELEKTIDFIKMQIDEIQKYCQSLIYEAVTGKIDVRNYKESDLEVNV